MYLSSFFSIHDTKIAYKFECHLKLFCHGISLASVISFNKLYCEYKSQKPDFKAGINFNFLV